MTRPGAGILALALVVAGPALAARPAHWRADEGTGLPAASASYFQALAAGAANFRVGRATGPAAGTAAEAAARGEVELGFSPTESLAALQPALRLFEAPYLFRGRRHLEAVLDGPLADDLLGGLASKGLVGLAFAAAPGARGLACGGGPLRAARDAAMKRVAVEGPAAATTWLAALGATAVPAPAGTAPALAREGRVNCALTPWEPLADGLLGAEMPDVGLPGVTYGVAVVYAGKAWFDRLPADEREKLRAAARSAARAQRAGALRREELLEDSARAKGVLPLYQTAEGRRAAVTAAHAFYEEVTAAVGQARLDSVATTPDVPPPAAERDLTAALTAKPADAEAGLALAGLLRGQPEAAAPYAERAARDARQPETRAAAHLLAGELRLSLGDGARASSELRQALTLGRDPVETLELLARAASDEPQRKRLAEQLAEAAGFQPLWLRARAYRASARVWRLVGEPARAVEALERSLALSPEDAETLAILVKLRRESKLPVRLDRAGADEPPMPLVVVDEVEQLASRTAQLSRKGDLGGARRLAGQLLKRARREPLWRRGPALLRAALVLGGLKQVHEAVDALSRAPGLQPLSPDVIRALAPLCLPQPSCRDLVDGHAVAAAFDRAAEAHAALGDQDGARRLLGSALSADGKDRLALSRLSELEVSGGLPFRAVDHARGLLALSESDPEKAAALVLLAAGQRASGDPESARRSLDEAVSLRPDDARAREAAASLALERGRPADAAGHLARLAALAPAGPERAGLQVRLAGALRDAGRAAEAVDALKSALEGDPAGPASLPAVGALPRLELALGRKSEALAHADALVAGIEKGARPQLPEALFERAETRAGSGDLAGARADLERAAALPGAAASALGRLVELELANGRSRQAVGYADRLVELSSGTAAAQAYALRARVLQARGKSARAQKDLESALAADPGDCRAGLALLTLQLDRGLAAQSLERSQSLEKPCGSAADASELHRARAHAYRQLRDPAREGQELSLAVGGGSDLVTLRALVASLRDAGKSAEAAAAAERLVAAGAGAPAAEQASDLESRAGTLLAVGDDAGAARAYQRALELRPEAADSTDRLQLLRLSIEQLRGRPSDAAALVERAKPSDTRAQARWRAARALARDAAGDAAGAREDFGAAASSDGKALCLGPVFQPARERLPLSYFDVCVERFPREASLRLDRGVARVQAGKSEDALADLRQAATLAPDVEAVQISLVSTLMSLGRRDEALSVAEAALGRAKDGRMNMLAEMRDSLRRKP